MRRKNPHSHLQSLSYLCVLQNIPCCHPLGDSRCAWNSQERRDLHRRHGICRSCVWPWGQVHPHAAQPMQLGGAVEHRWCGVVLSCDGALRIPGDWPAWPGQSTIRPRHAATLRLPHSGRQTRSLVLSQKGRLQQASDTSTLATSRP